MTTKGRRRKPVSSGLTLPPFDAESGNLHVVVDTPKGSRNKYKWDEEKQLFRLAGILPAGADFPFDFGDVPSTRGEDGDPLDVLVLMDEAAFVGCLVLCRLLGAIEAEQTKEKKTERNDRLIAVADTSRTHAGVRRLSDLPDNLLAEIEHFFVSYNAVKGADFRPLARRGPQVARRLVEEGQKRFRGGGRSATKSKS